MRFIIFTVVFLLCCLILESQNSQASTLVLKNNSGAENQIEPESDGSPSQAPKLERAQENWIFEVPGLGSLSPKRYSWAFVRGSKIWVQNQPVLLSKIEWPEWDKTQLPVALIPKSTVGKWFIIVLDSEKKTVEKIPFDRPWQPEKTKKTLGDKAMHFAVEFVAGDRYRVRSPVIPWLKRKDVFKCEFEMDLESSLKKVEKDSQLQACLESLAGISEETEQWFVEIQWPKFSDGEALRYVLKKERELGVPLKKRKHIFQSTKIPSSQFRIIAGRTLVEELPLVAFDAETLGDHELLIAAPEPKELSKPWSVLKTLKGGELELYSLAIDAVADESLYSPTIFMPRLWVQFTGQMDKNNLPQGIREDLKSSTEPVAVREQRIRRTDFPEYYSGLSGFLRPWYVQTSAVFNSLQSSRQEKSSIFGFGAVEARTFFREFLGGGWGPRFYLERDIVHLGSDLSVTELQLTVHGPYDWLKYVAPYVGFIGYSLGGTNPGSTRLGGVLQGVLGVSYQTYAQPFFILGHFGLAPSLGGLSPQIGLDTQVQLSWMFSPESREGLFVGLYTGYSTYSAELTVAATRTQEVFAERRIRLGLSLGWAGRDFIESSALK
jgi:hypothetical protein